MVDLHSIKLPKLKEEDRNRTSIKKDYMRQEGQIAAANLVKNNFSATYCDSIEDARNLVLKLIPENSIVGCGDSHTIFALEQIGRASCRERV